MTIAEQNELMVSGTRQIKINKLKHHKFTTVHNLENSGGAGPMETNGVGIEHDAFNIQ